MNRVAMGTLGKKQRTATRPGTKAPAQRPPATGGRPAKRRRDQADAPDRAAPQLAEIDAEVLEFIEALDRFKRQHGRPFPSWSEVLMVLRDLGYRRD
ncbi:MAG: hypothetical protein KF830_13465 [Planctomycetes bacterium]|nr:hypothetical protein [Planctomycetota bacterium]